MVRGGISSKRAWHSNAHVLNSVDAQTLKYAASDVESIIPPQSTIKSTKLAISFFKINERISYNYEIH